MSTAKRNTASFRLVWSLAVISLAAVCLWFGADLNTAKAQVKVKDRGLVASNLGGTTFPGTGTGAIPDRGSPGCGPPAGPNLDISFNVTGLPAEAPGSVDLDITLGHTWVGDLNVSLIAPDATEHVVFASTGSTTATGCGDSSDLGATYLFGDSETGDWWAEAGAQTGGGVLTAGGYRTTVSGDQPSPPGGDPSDMNAAFAGIPDQNGTWILRLNDSGGGDTGSVSAANLTLGGGAAPSGTVHNDFDGDGTTDYSIVRDETPSPLAGSDRRAWPKSYREGLEQRKELPTGGANLGGPPPAGTNVAWYVHNSSNNTAAISAFGEPSTDFFAPADYDGDGIVDLTIWRPIMAGGPDGAFFYTIQSSDSTVVVTDFGQIGDDPTVSGDYDGDGEADFAVYRCPSTAGQCNYYYKGSAGGGEITFVPWGNGTQFTLFPNPGDFDSDGKYDFNIQRTNPDVPGGGQFVLLRSSDNGVEYINWGLNTDLIAPGDYDGDGQDDTAVGRNEGGLRVWYVLERDGGMQSGQFGTSSDFMVPGDYDGDGKTDIAVWRPSNGEHYVLRSSDGMVSGFAWGLSGDYPLANWQVH